jgi:hypothetical protein
VGARAPQTSVCTDIAPELPIARPNANLNQIRRIVIDDCDLKTSKIALHLSVQPTRFHASASDDMAGLTLGVVVDPRAQCPPVLELGLRFCLVDRFVPRVGDR